MKRLLILAAAIGILACEPAQGRSNAKPEKRWEVRCYQYGKEIYYGTGTSVSIYSDGEFRLHDGDEMVLKTTATCIASKKW